MANELTHKDPGAELTQAEFIASDGTGHVFESQATGDILYASSATVLSRLEKATDGNILELASNLPAWTASPTIGSTNWGNANHAHAASNSGGTLTTLGTITTGVWNGTAIATAYIGADAITGAKIADDALDSEHYTDGSIDTAHLAADAVTGAKIADDAIDSEHYADGSIDNAHIADDAIDSEHYAAGSIDTAHIADNQVTAAKLADIARGSIIYGNASAATAELTKGSANTVLTSDGTDISWAAASTASHGASSHTDITRTIFIPVSPVHTNGVYEPNRLALIKLPVDVIATANFTFQVPVDYSSHSESTAIQLVWFTNAGTTNNMYGRFCSYGQGAGESVEGTSECTSEEVMAAGGNKIINVSNKPDALDLSGIAIGDYIGIDFRRNGSHASDTISDDVRVLGLLFTYTALQ
jgi:hypothetical protein